MSNKEICKSLLQEYFKLATQDFNKAFTERGYGNREKGQQMVDACKQRKAELEEQIIGMVEE